MRGRASTAAAGAELMVETVAAELAAAECFRAWQAAELRRLPCSHCGTHHDAATYAANMARAAAAGGPGVPDIHGARIENREAGGALAACAVCRKSVAASRYAPHLEKCMGIGGRAAKATGASAAALPSAQPQQHASKIDQGKKTKHKAKAAAQPSESESVDEAFVPAAPRPKRKAPRPKGGRQAPLHGGVAPPPRPAPVTANSAVSLIAADFADPHGLDDMLM